MSRRLLVRLIILLCLVSALAEESRLNPAIAANENLQQVAPGDHWTYEIKDEISGSVKFKRTDLVTDVSPKDISVRIDMDNRTTNVLYDQSWNILRSGPFKYSPNDGTGFQLPLTVGAKWKFAIDVANSANGQTFRRVGNSQVISQESISTKAGTFDAFVIEINYTGKLVQNPALINETSEHVWFNPSVNHWIKRNVVRRQGGHIVANDTSELIDYGRKKE